MLWLRLFCINTFLLGESIEMVLVVDGTHPWQFCRGCCLRTSLPWASHKPLYKRLHHQPNYLGKVKMGLVVDGTHPWQLCRSCDFIAQG